MMLKAPSGPADTDKSVAADKPLLAGFLLGTLSMQQVDPTSPFMILDVQLVLDDDGNSTPTIQVTMPSGKYLVMVTEATVIAAEEP